jgi:hypothetical protein
MLLGFKERIQRNRTMLLILVFFLLMNLRILTWLQPGFVAFSGDLRPPMNPTALLQHGLTWNTIDFGMPSVYLPRLLDPYMIFTAAFQFAGLNLAAANALAIYLIFVFAALLMYIYVKNLLDGDVVAGFIAAVFLITNLSLLVDREVQAVLLVDDALLILPCLVAFTIGLKKKSLPFMALSGFSFVLTYATFPNPRISIIALLSLLLTALYVAVNKGRKSFRLQTIKTRVKPFAVFLVSVAIVSAWIAAFVAINLNAFLGTYGQLSSLTNYNLDIKPVDTLRLIAYWGFYGSALGQPYVPYANVYLHNLFVYALSFVPTVLAFEALFISKNRKAAAFFTGAALLSLALTNGVAWEQVTSIPLMMTFRLTTNWIFFTVFAFSILIGLTVSALYGKTKRGNLKILTLFLTCIVLCAAAYPMFTGDIARNWMDPANKGTYIPAYFNEANNIISSRHYTLLLPQRIAFVTYNFTEGMMSCGNPYPLIFSKPYISGVGTEYVQSPNTELLNKVYGIAQNNVALEGSVGSSSSNDAALAIDGYFDTIWQFDPSNSSSNSFQIDWNQSQTLSSITILFESAYENNCTIETWNGNGWTLQIAVPNNSSATPEYIFPQETTTTSLRITFTKAAPLELMRIREIQIYNDLPIDESTIKTLGMLGVRNLLVENNIVYGNMSEVKHIEIQNGNSGITLIQKWNEAALYDNEYAQEILYPASNVIEFFDFFNMTRVINNTKWPTLQHSAFLKSTSSMNRTTVGTLKTPESFSWTELSPTSFKATAKADGPFLIVFLESYNTHWKASVNGQRISEVNHAEINGFANGWLVNATGNLTITVEYETQNLITAAGAASVILTATFAIIILLRRNIAKTIKNILVKLRKKSEQTST